MQQNCWKAHRWKTGDGMEINESEEKEKSVLKADKPVSEFPGKELEARKSLLWDLIRSKFEKGDPWAVAEITEITYTLTRKEIEREEERQATDAEETKQLNDSTAEWEPYKRKH